MKLNRSSLFLATTLFSLLVLTACKKSNNSSSDGSMSATVNGSAFSAAGTIAAYTQSGGFYAIDGLTVKAGLDTTAIEIGLFPPLVTNTPITTDNSAMSVLYTISSKNYLADFNAGTATLTLTTVDTVNHKLAGTFSGTLYNVANNSDSVLVTNGQFNTSYTVEP